MSTTQKTDAVLAVRPVAVERIEADEIAVPAAWQYRYKNDRMQWSRWIEWVPEEHPEAPFPKMIGRWEVEYRKLFIHPPAQAAMERLGSKIEVQKCPCGHRGCSDYHLRGIGKFVQGSGFTKEEAEHIAKLLNEYERL